MQIYRDEGIYFEIYSRLYRTSKINFVYEFIFQGVPSTPGIIPPSMTGQFQGADSNPFQFPITDPFAKGQRFREPPRTSTELDEEPLKNPLEAMPTFQRRTTQTRLVMMIFS